MTGTDEIIRRLEAEANEVARDYLEHQAELERAEDIVRMEMLIEDLAQAIVERGDASELSTLGVRMKETSDGTLWFIKNTKKLALRPRENMTIKVGQATVYPNRDNPVFDEKFYVDVMGRVYQWAEKINRPAQD